MPFCPVCRAEYRHGITYCSDCDVELVESLDGVDALKETADAPLIEGKLCELEEFFSEDAEFLVCSSCGCAVDETDDFCPACGEPLEDLDE